MRNENIYQTNMRNADVYIASDNIVSPLGLTTAVNFSQLKKAVSGIRLHDDATLSAQPFYAALFGDKEGLIKEPSPGVKQRTAEMYTKFEQLLIASIQSALQDSRIEASDKKTVLIISSTKGN